MNVKTFAELVRGEGRKQKGCPSPVLALDIRQMKRPTDRSPAHAGKEPPGHPFCISKASEHAGVGETASRLEACKALEQS